MECLVKKNSFLRKLRLNSFGTLWISVLMMVFGLVAVMSQRALAEPFMTSTRAKAAGSCECPAENIEGTFDECPLEVVGGGPACGDKRCFKADSTDAGCAENYSGEYCGCLKECTFTPDPGKDPMDPSTGMSSPSNTPEASCVNSSWHDGDGTWNCIATKYKKKKEGDTPSAGYNDYTCYYTPGAYHVLDTHGVRELASSNELR